MKTINDFIKELKSISKENRKLPLVIESNGSLVSPEIKMVYINEPSVFNQQLLKMIISSNSLTQ